MADDVHAILNRWVVSVICMEDKPDPAG